MGREREKWLNLTFDLRFFFQNMCVIRKSEVTGRSYDGLVMRPLQQITFSGAYI